MSNTGGMSNVWFGQGVADDSEFRLCGDAQGKRVIELGIPPLPHGVVPNAITLALDGAKAIAVEPSGERISALRAAAERHEVSVECHQGELADLGFATSASVDLVVAAHTLDHVDDLQRLLRQVHRVLKPETPFVIALTHPVAAMFDPGVSSPVRRYGGAGTRSMSDLFMHIERSNFHIDVLHELPLLAHRDPLIPSVLLLRARKLGV